MAKKTKEFSTEEEKEAYICSFVTEMWKHGERETTEDRRRWSYAFDLFNGKMEWEQFREQTDWMSRPFIHEFSVVIRRVAEIMTNTIFEKEDFLEITAADPENEGQVEFARLFEKIIKYDFLQVNIESIFSEFCIAAGASGVGILKVEPSFVPVWGPQEIIDEIKKDDAKEQKRQDKQISSGVEIPNDEGQLETIFEQEIQKLFGGAPLKRDVKATKNLEYRLNVSTVDPRNFVADPDCSRLQDSHYKIERTMSALFKLQPLFDSGVFDKTKWEKIKKSKATRSEVSTVSSYSEQKMRTRDQWDSKNEYMPQVELLSYFGPLLGKDGRIIEECGHYVVANQKVLLRSRTIPYWNKKAPYLIGIFCKSPFKAVGRGISDNGIEQQELINNLFAVFCDMLKLATYQPIVLDDTALREPSEVANGLYPGMLIKTFGKRAEDVFSKVDLTPNAAPYIFQTIEKLSLSLQRGASVDVTSSNPASRARITAAEIDSNMGRSEDSTLALGRELDSSIVKPLIKAVTDYRLQFGLGAEELQNLKAAGVLTEEEHQMLMGIPEIERFNEIKKSYKIKIRGFRNRLERQVFLQYVNQFLSTLSQFPPETINSIDFKQLLSEIVDAYGFDSNRWIIHNNPQDEAREENDILAQGRFVSILPDDDHQAHLLVHGPQFLKTPNEQVLVHINEHAQALMQIGVPLPELPPEVLQALGLDQQGQQPPPTPEGETIQ